MSQPDNPFTDFAPPGRWPSWDDLLALDWTQPPAAPPAPGKENVLLLPDFGGLPDSAANSPEISGPVAESVANFDLADPLRPLTSPRDTTAGAKHLLFNLGATVYALPVESIVEIHRPLPVTPLPNLPAWFPGVTNLRGDILAVFDLGAFLGLTERAGAPRQRMMVVRSSQPAIETVMVVDQVRELHYFSLEQITTSATIPPATRRPFCRGLARHKGEPVYLLALEEVLGQSANGNGT